MSLQTCGSCALAFASPKARASHERIHMTSIEGRLLERVDVHGPVPVHAPELGRCWVWTGHTVEGGYGRMVVNGFSRGVHRISLAIALGRPLGPGMNACHRCDNPPCVNPAHLFEGSTQDNVDDRHTKARDAMGATNGRARLTADDVRSIKSQLAAGASWSSVAAEAGVSKGSIQAIAQGRTWAHVS